MTTMPSVIVAGASTGIRASYAERFQRCGHDLVLVASDEVRTHVADPDPKWLLTLMMASVIYIKHDDRH